MLISDGQPVDGSNDDAALESIIGTGRDGCEDLSASIFDDPGLSELERTSGTCGPELVARRWRARRSSTACPRAR